ncbi:hypothetical protein PHET_00902 [Paragonimus heterotremus]|uniref:Uncharacterized protein n=1 Tax=Paragonimus heterotremus TaxID=100268 RepID=A0A8J4T6B9_9TREM|nr:hypothetical protein PHET_00902 [Paragonimus heterotremus]
MMMMMIFTNISGCFVSTKVCCHWNALPRDLIDVPNMPPLNHNKTYTCLDFYSAIPDQVCTHGRSGWILANTTSRCLKKW